MHYLYPGFPAYMPCPYCGASVKRGEQDQHDCNEDRQKDFEFYRQFGQELTEFETELTIYLMSNEAKFFSWLGQRHLRF